MIILASSNNKVIQRWNSAVRGPREVFPEKSLGRLNSRIKDNPDSVVVLHSSLDGIRGLGDIQGLHHSYPGSKLLVLEDVPNETNCVELIRAGILGYGNTYIEPFVLAEAVKVIEMGEMWITKRVVQWLANNCAVDIPTGDPVDRSMLKGLTPSERKIIDYLLDGDSNKTIARRLDISERTVKAHLTSIFRKTGIKDRLHLVLAIAGKSP